MAEKTAFEPLAKIFADTPVSTWRDYLTVHYLHSCRAYLPKRFDDRDFAFYGTVLAGSTQQLDRADARRASARRPDGRGAGQGLCRAAISRPKPRPRPMQLVANLLKAYDGRHPDAWTG